MKIICGSNNKPLCNDIIQRLQNKHQAITINSKNFADGESYVELEDEVNDDSVAVIQSTNGNNSLMELLLIVDTLKNLEVKNIIAVIPYLGYSRQDRRVHPRSPISINLIANMLVCAGVTKVITVDLHSKAGENCFDVPILNLSTANLFFEHYRKFYSAEQSLVIAPDLGGKDRAEKFAKQLNVEVSVIHKKRPEPGVSQVVDIVGSDVKGKNLVVIDDIVDSAGTLCNSVAFLKENGAKTVIAYITHGVFSKNAVQRINESMLDKIYITDSILHKNITSNKIEVLSLADMIAINLA